MATSVSGDKTKMSASSVFASLIKSAPHLIRMSLSLFSMYLTLGWRVRKARRAFEKQVVLQGMSKDDAKRLSICYEELKNNVLTMLRRGFGRGFK